MSELGLRARFKSEFLKANSPTNLVDKIDSATDEQLKLWADWVDESPFLLSDWVSSLIIFSNWEKKQARGLTLMSQFQYLSCCAEASRQTSGLVTLADSLEYFLENHGVE